MINMPDNLKKTMDTLFPIKDEPFNLSIHERTTHYANMEKRAGFHACYDVMKEREKRLVKSLEHAITVFSDHDEYKYWVENVLGDALPDIADFETDINEIDAARRLVAASEIGE